ncbi:hypothetical protein Tco_1121887 [Tanacetum coccineum]|uniref:Uncharacterized protein n=1 Tax=Tanacetum coccineum TaxID=301880 RepID=A0ABQ5IYZ8_9ASTR
MCLRNRSLISWWLINLGTVNLALVEIVPSVLIVIVSPIEIALIIPLMALNGRKTRRSNLICNHLRMTPPQVTQLCSSALRELGLVSTRINAQPYLSLSKSDEPSWALLEAFYPKVTTPTEFNEIMIIQNIGHYRMYRVDAILKTQDAGIPEKIIESSHAS